MAEDAAVLQVVFDDMLCKDNDESPAEWTGDQSKPVYVSKDVPERRLDARQVLSLRDKAKLKALTNAERGARHRRQPMIWSPGLKRGADFRS